MKSLSLAELIKAHNSIYGFLNSVPSPLLCEMAGRAGYQFVILDMEHLLVSESEILSYIRCCELAGVAPWVRVPDANPKRIGRLLDNGVSAIVLPKVESSQEVEQAVKACWFPPYGTRTITGGRITGFGTIPLADYIEQVRQQTFIIPMIESRKGVECLTDILQLDGVAAVMDGALDLSLDIGAGPNPAHKEVYDIVKSLIRACHARNIVYCANPRTSLQQHELIEEGVKCFLVGEDRGIVLAALQNRLSDLKSESHS